jgi:DNA polymerase-3 subunit gamma/tau
MEDASKRTPGTSNHTAGVEESQKDETTPETSKDLELTWKRILDFTGRENPVLGALLHHGRLLALDDRTVEIGFRKESFYYERIQEDANKNALAEVCRSLLKKDLQLVFSIIKENSKQSSETKRERETDRNRHLRKEVLENPIVKDALEIFDGEIEEIKVGTRFES